MLWVLFKLLLFFPSVIFFKFFLAHWTSADPFQPLKNALLVEHVFAWKFNDLLIGLELHIAYRAKVWFWILFLVFHFIQTIQLLLVQTWILVGVGASGQHLNQLNECWRVGAVCTDDKVGATIGWKSDNLISGPTSLLMLVFKRVAPKEGMSKKIHQRTRIVHVSVSLVKYHRHAVLIIWIKLLFMSSHSVPASLISFKIDWIFLANLHVVIH